MFDIAWSELIVIIVVALVVVGPKDLPRLMRTAGQWAGRARAMADQFRRSFDDMARQAELDELRAEVNKLQQSPLGDEDYAASIGLPDNPISPVSNIEEVGAAPPKFDTPAETTPSIAQPGTPPVSGEAAKPEVMPVPSGVAPQPTTQS